MATSKNAVLDELSAVNLMLSNIGEDPVNTLDDTGLADAVLARNMLRNISRQVQMKGLTCNTERGAVLSPEAPTPGKIPLPLGTLRVDTTGRSANENLVMQGEGGSMKFWDVDNNTDTFTESVEVDIVKLKNFDDLSPVARDYIAVRAAKRFSEAMVGSSTLSAFLGLDEAEINATFASDELDVRDLNVLTGSLSMRRIAGYRRRR